MENYQCRQFRTGNFLEEIEVKLTGKSPGEADSDDVVRDKIAAEQGESRSKSTSRSDR
jgi:hypothetical protein